MSTKIQQKEATVKIQTKQIKEATITAKLQISQELNHKREAITDYYLKRTE